MGKAKVFIAYARKDRGLRDDLQSHLAFLRSEIHIFYDGLIEPGAKWDSVLRNQIGKADIVLFLLSPDMFASTYVMEEEVPRAFIRHDEGEAVVIPILVRHTGLGQPFFGRHFLQSHDGKAVDSSGDRDLAWQTITSEIAKKVRIINARATSVEAGFTTLMLEQLKQVLPNELEAPASVWLSTRTGLGWSSDLGDRMTGLPLETDGRFLFLDPHGRSFQLDSELAWDPSPDMGKRTARTTEQRRDSAKALFDDLIRAGHSVRVTDVLLPASFWAIGTDGSSDPNSAFVEIPIWKSQHGGNLYIQAAGKDPYVDAYRQVFQDLWGRARPWPG